MSKIETLYLNYYTLLNVEKEVTYCSSIREEECHGMHTFIDQEELTNEIIKVVIKVMGKEIDITNEISGSSINNYLTMSGLTGTTFQISLSEYTSAPYYDLSDYIDLTPLNDTDVLNFGDEYYFYGNFETDISATIYEMKYLVTLGRNQFTNTSNPTWTSGTTSYVTEIGLYDTNKDLIVISKLQSPELRQGIQQYVVKLDF